MDCSVVRDLMPLVIDHAASENSEQLVQAHLRECRPCTEYWHGLQAQLTSRKSVMETERQGFDQAARRLRRKRRRGVWRNVLIGMLVGTLLVFGGLWGWQRLTQDYHTTVYYGEYGVHLAQLSGGSVAVNIDFRGSDLCGGIQLDDVAAPGTGESILYVCNKRSFIKQHMSNPQRNYACCVIPPERLNQYSEIRKGTPTEYEIIWRQGDGIPAASAELEEYCRLKDQLRSLLEGQMRDGQAYALSRAEEEIHGSILERMEALDQTVPEWR